MTEILEKEILDEIKTGRSAENISMPEVNSTIPVDLSANFWRKLFSFAGPGFLIAVGYMDPGNWATDLAGGARFGYTLLSVIMISNLMAMLLQHLSLKLGIVTGHDLAQECRMTYSPGFTIFLWIICEIAIAACDLAEVIGSAVALNLLFHIPLVVGVILTALDVLIVLYLQNKGFRYIEALVAGLIGIIGFCFIYELFLSSPSVPGILNGFIPRAEIVSNPGMLYIAIGILGATVMPHNLYLHSSIVQTRKYTRSALGKEMAIKFGTIDSTMALMIALFINASILILSAAAFHGTGHEDVADINDAYKLLSPLLGVPVASIFFGVALLASGQNATLTGTMAGQIVMEGFINLRLRPWIRRLLTRMVAIVPAVIIAALYGERGVGSLLIFSQVILSLQLSFAVVPLVTFTGNRLKMGKFVNSRAMNIIAWTIAILIILLNGYLLFQFISS
ncbi:MAG TPA: Nramp family divalent metal transporter [Bacteroidales bacterium]|nr:Nramp family divalent metal transporter [Bacteroidales bacterium]